MTRESVPPGWAPVHLRFTCPRLQPRLSARVHPVLSFSLQPEVDETVHLVSLAADFQQYDFRAFSAIYNPDDLRELLNLSV